MSLPESLADRLLPRGPWWVRLIRVAVIWALFWGAWLRFGRH